MPSALNHARIVVAGVLAAGLAACGGSGAAGSPTAPAPTGMQTCGTTTNAVTDGAAPSIAIAGDGISPAASNGSGAFTISTATDPATPRTVTLTGAGFVTRQTYLRIPGSDALVSLIPTSLDLRAFDEMFRTSMLLRWTTAP